MKKSDIHYLCNEGSIKYGAANVNDTNVIEDIDNIDSLKSFTIDMYSAGIQLDKEHSVD
mgnify:CR=1 FL=1